MCSHGSALGGAFTNAGYCVLTAAKPFPRLWGGGNQHDKVCLQGTHSSGKGNKLNIKSVINAMKKKQG